MIGQVVSHYRVLAELGTGGMGVVYRAEDLRLGRNVALKFLSSETSRGPAALERFRREAEAISALNHPNVCTLYDIGEHDGRQFLVLELVDGRTLTEVIRGGPLPFEQALHLAINIADALAAAHSQGIVHRDVKPGNVLVTARGDAKLLDFGIAVLDAQPQSLHASNAVTREPLTLPGSAIGTPAYMAPEQLRGEPADSRSDVFALGMVMQEMVSAKASNAAAPPELSHIIARALEKDAQFRYQTASDLLSDLRRLQRDTTSPHVDRGPQAVAGLPGRRRAPLAIAAAALAVTIASGSVWWMTSRNALEPAPPGPQSADSPVRLVVLPFENLTRRPDDDWLAGAFSDSLSAGLQPLNSLILVPRERVVELYAAEKQPDAAALSADLARQLAQKLRVGYYVHGSYQRVDDAMRVMARLVDVTADAVRAQETVTGQFADVLRLEEQLASRFATSLGSAPALKLAARPSTPNLDAYQLVTNARALYALGRFNEARALLVKATTLDPGYALAWALLAKSDARLLSPAVASGRPEAEALNAALREATTAVTLDATSIESHLALALAYRGLRDHVRWRESAARAATLDPRNGEARIILGDSMSISPGFGCPTAAQSDAAVEAFREGLRIDPLFGSGYVNYTTHLWWLGRRVEALAVVDEGLAVQPANVLLNGSRPFNLLFANRVDEAERLLRQRVDSATTLTPLEELTLAYLALQRQRFDEAALRLRSVVAQRAVTNLALTLITAVAYFDANRPGEGADYLARGIAAEPECAAWAQRVPALAPYRATPEFARAVATR